MLNCAFTDTGRSVARQRFGKALLDSDSWRLSGPGALQPEPDRVGHYRQTGGLRNTCLAVVVNRVLWLWQRRTSGRGSPLERRLD
jgi:hypothetical protein